MLNVTCMIHNEFISNTIFHKIFLVDKPSQTPITHATPFDPKPIIFDFGNFISTNKFDIASYIDF